jgi:hypothetical protein
MDGRICTEPAAKFLKSADMKRIFRTTAKYWGQEDDVDLMARNTRVR